MQFLPTIKFSDQNKSKFMKMKIAAAISFSAAMSPCIIVGLSLLLHLRSKWFLGRRCRFVGNPFHRTVARDSIHWGKAGMVPISYPKSFSILLYQPILPVQPCRHEIHAFPVTDHTREQPCHSTTT